MANKDPWANKQVDIAHSGTRIILPSDPVEMPAEKAVECLKQLIRDENSEVSIHETIEAYPWDGALAFMLAIRETFGWANMKSERTFFGVKHPTFISVRTGPGEHDVTQCIWGQFTLPGISGYLETGIDIVDNRRVFCVNGTVYKKYQPAIAKLAKLAREIVKRSSIYRHRAFKLPVDDKGGIDYDEQPRFIDTAAIDPSQLILSKEVEKQIETSLFAPIMHSATCRRHRVPLSRGILLEGKYGVGKTLTASMTAKKCVDNNWTFISIESVTALADALKFARMYAPAVVFAEDIDRVLKGDRTVSMDHILNIIDGVDGKNDEIITILTTNHVENINAAMLRPGRLDAVISVTPPDAEASERLMRLYGRGLIKDEEKLSGAGKAVAGQIPAVIREVVERAKLAAIYRSSSGEFFLTDEDIVTAAEGMKMHLKLIQGKGETVLTPEQRIGQGIAETMTGTVEKVLKSKLHPKVLRDNS